MIITKLQMHSHKTHMGDDADPMYVGRGVIFDYLIIAESSC